MNNLFSSLLEQIKQNYKNKATTSTEITSLVSDVIGFQLQEKDIKISQGVLYITVSPTIKSTVMQHKKELLEKLASWGVSAIR
ncbi:MAG: hypothetical protein WCQ32_00455 [bacterium]